jgi:predicted Rossmann-fold nucleotide-binding protein
VVEIENEQAVRELLASGAPLIDVVFQGIDLREVGEGLIERDLSKAVFLGCDLDTALLERARADGALIFPTITGIPFHPYRAALYGVEELYDVFDRHRPESYRACLDARVYEHWHRTGRATPGSILETLARRLHDHAISDALEELIEGERVVAIMGGHGMDRGPGAYTMVARIARELARRGFMLCSGGGPGAMEATHLGAWFVDRDEDEMVEAIGLLARAPRYDDVEWLSRAFEVRERWPLTEAARNGHPSVGIPTWLYGHEPPNAFATHVAKYFANSVREDGLLTIAKAGVLYSPGSAGTIQEIFQDACQNHYASVGVVSPMVFIGRHYWTEDKPVYPLLEQLARGRDYARWLSITDDVDEAVAAIQRYADEGPD